MPNKHTLPPGFRPAEFHAALLCWYERKGRDLPWRAKPGREVDPYRVWLSEVMLQQTTVKAALPYYEKFLTLWPTVEALAAAAREDVLAAWAGLGYYSRARNLHACARQLASAGFPKSARDLRTLPGIGAYTAAAIASIAFDEPAAVVDGNVERVVARLFAVGAPLPASKREIAAAAAALTPDTRPGDYAQAMMDLGATVCTPKSPACGVCPIATCCGAFAAKRPEDFPVKIRQQAKPIRHGAAYVVVLQNGGMPLILLRRRPEKGLLGGMMEVPSTKWALAGSADTPELAELGTLSGNWKAGAGVRHAFTHFALDLSVNAADRAVREDLARSLNGQWVPLAAVGEAGLPTVMKKAVVSGLHALGLRWPSSQ